MGSSRVLRQSWRASSFNGVIMHNRWRLRQDVRRELCHTGTLFLPSSWRGLRLVSHPQYNGRKKIGKDESWEEKHEGADEGGAAHTRNESPYCSLAPPSSLDWFLACDVSCLRIFSDTLPNLSYIYRYRRRLQKPHSPQPNDGLLSIKRRNTCLRPTVPIAHRTADLEGVSFNFRKIAVVQSHLSLTLLNETSTFWCKASI